MVEQERAKVHLRVVRFVAKVILGPSHSVVLCTLVYNFSFRRPLHACLQLQAAPQSVTVSFFQRPPHRLVADRVHDRQRDQLVGQELHRPLVAARRRRRAGQSDEPGLGRPIAFALAAGPLLLLATQGVVQALLDEALADALDGSYADLDRLADALVGPGRPAVGGVGLEQDAGAGELLGGGLAGGDQGGQLRAFLGGQRNLVLLHGVPPETVTASGEPTRMHQASQKWPATSYVLHQYHHQRVTQPLLLEQLRQLGLDISVGQLNHLLTEGRDAFHQEKEELLPAGLQASSYIGVDDTGARHQGQTGSCLHIGNELFAYFESTDSKSRLNFLSILRKPHTDYVVNEVAVAYWDRQGLAQAVRAVLRSGDVVAASAERDGRGVAGEPDSPRRGGGPGGAQRRGAAVRRAGAGLVLAARRTAAGPPGAVRGGAPSGDRRGAAAHLGVVPGVNSVSAPAGAGGAGGVGGALRRRGCGADGVPVGRGGAEGDGGAPGGPAAGAGAAGSAVAPHCQGKPHPGAGDQAEGE